MCGKNKSRITVNITNFLRTKEWHYSKVPMLMSVMLYFYIVNNSTITTIFLIQYICFFIFVYTYLAFSYVINDYADMEIDRIVGKTKVITNLTTLKIILILIFMILLSTLPILIYNKFNFHIFLLIFITFFLGASYSIMPFRFKEMGIIGLMVASAAQRCLPLLIAYELIQMSNFLFLMWMLLSFILGIRYILIHQILDYENDKKANVVTFTRNNFKKARIGIYLSFVMEIMCLIAVLVPISDMLFLKIPLFIYIIVEGLTCVSIGKLINENCFMTFDCVPLEDLYNIYLPILFTIYLYIVTKDFRFIPLVIITIIYLWVAIKSKINFLQIYIRSKIEGS